MLVEFVLCLGKIICIVLVGVEDVGGEEGGEEEDDLLFVFQGFIKIFEFSYLGWVFYYNGFFGFVSQ